MAEQDVLAKPLPTPVPPSGKGRVGFKEAIGIDQPFLARKAELQPEISKAEGDIAKAQQEQKEIKATGELSAQMRFGQEQEAAMQAYQGKMEAEPIPAFIPSKDSAQDIAGLFGVISVISMLVGGGGRMSGQLALGNMNGMMEGYRKGRKDLYEKERNEFDKNFKAMLKKHEEFRKEMEDAIKLATTNKEEGFRAAELAATKAGSDIVKAQLRKGDLVGAYKLVDESQKGANHALQIEQKAKDQEAAEKFRKEQAAQAAQLRKDLLAMKATQPSAKQLKDYTSVSELVQDKTGARLKDKDAEQVAIAANAIGDANAIKQIVKEHPEWVGRSGQIKNFFNRYLDSINFGTPAPDDKGQPELVFAKRYAEYLVNYERALAGGAKGFTVFFQRRFNQLLEQNQFNAAGMNNLMDEQVRTITSQVATKAKEINKDSLMNLAKDIKERAGDEEALRGMSGETKPTAKESTGALTAEEEAELKALKEKHGRK